MEISLFTSSNKTVLARRSGKIIEHVVLDSRIIFQNPDLLRDRLLLTLNKKLGVIDPGQIKKMVFGISGIVDSESGSIVRSHILNELSAPKGYGGFSFKDAFGSLVGRENVLIINDAAAISLGFRAQYPSIALPLLSLFIDIGVGVSLINENGELLTTEIGHHLIEGLGNKPVYSILSQSGIDDLLMLKTNDLYESYTKNLMIISAYYNEYEKGMLYPSNSNDTKTTVCIWSSKSEFIDPHILAENQFGLNFILPQNESEKSIIPVAGLFAYVNYQKPAKTILKIDYFSGEEKIYSFSTYKQFLDHWSNVKSFANPDNQYRVHYSDNVVKSIKIRDLDDIMQLEEYKF